ncbi:MAG: vanadium-dependent haloperoxidase [Acaryochloridaceae cyanobacterium CSU_3_4]|nr:vanadium-dependent haloperoxidase [Acaryochloridaceae cyanobacterium CSU_3_4]
MDSILFWNDVALEANRVSHTDGKKEQNGPTLSSRALAIVHLAMYDAYAGINGGLPAYLPGLPSGNGSPQAAVAAAAHATLSTLFPSQKAFFDTKLSEAGTILDPGHDFGIAVAQAILQDRAADPSDSDAGYVPSLARGRHRSDPDNPGQPFNAPFYGPRSKGFAITVRHELDDPPFDSPEYLNALREVRGRGIAPELMGTLPNNISARTIDQTLIGIFWGYDGASGLGTPPRLYNQIVRRLAIAKNNTEAQNARLFALVNAAMGDAGILAWQQKYRYNLWRPVLGIREHDQSMGLAGEADNNISDNTDTGWLPLGAPKTNSVGAKNFTPNFPAYPSGHATFGAAAFHITRLFYGVPCGDRGSDNLFDGLDFVSDEFNGVNVDNKGTIRPRHVRNFPGGLWQMIEENGRSRVYLGVHWVFDAFAVGPLGGLDLSRNIGGVPLGLNIAEDIFNTSNGGIQKSTVMPL